MSVRQFITVKEASNVLGVSRMTVYRLVRSGDLKSITVGRSIRIYRDEFEAYVNEGRSSDEGA